MNQRNSNKKLKQNTGVQQMADYDSKETQSLSVEAYRDDLRALILKHMEARGMTE